MKITAIKAQVKNTERVSVFVDGKYSFSLNHAQLLEQKIHSGLEIDEVRLAELKKTSDFGKIFDRMLNYAMIRPRSVWEMQQYCWRKKYNKDDCQTIIQKFLQRGYLGDMAFAKMWIESRRLTKATSQRKLRLELKQKGLDDAIITEALLNSQHLETDALREIISKKRRQTKYQDSQKLMQYLVRQGFNYDDIKSALD